MLTRIRSQLPLWRRALRRRRRTLALLTGALLVAALLPSALPALVPAAAASTTVVVAAAELPIGTELEAEHLRTVRVAESLAPPRAVDGPEQLTGRRTMTKVPEGVPVVPGMLEGEAAAVVPEGSSMMAISAPAVLAPHLVPGTAVEILSSTPEAGSTRHIRARVVEVAPREPGAGSGLAGPTAGETVVLVSVDPSGARELAHATHEGWVQITIVG
ncbi:MAG TPA: SAF domain-containing protein [Candidatus Brachybacterium merdavium]|uniref:SAF domain-containing protein n=1 Tax=Candidatus Brachybacterium merdavium TaxID=2838513 RepID=A0A9D2LGN5_9MICO|nr:SAF domain-containing protein [Candidatus Brachybacterium merdavium]